ARPAQYLRRSRLASDPPVARAPWSARLHDRSCRRPVRSVCGRGGLGLGGCGEGGSQQARRIAARRLLHRTRPGRSRGPISAWLWDFELGGLAGASRRICRLALPRSRDRAGRGVARGARCEPQGLADSRGARQMTAAAVWVRTGVAAVTAAFLTSIAPVTDAHAATARPVDGKALISAADDLEDWLTHGRTYDEQRFSPLDRINAANVKDLGLAWFADLDTARGQEATPLVIDGTVYITTAWSKVKAYDALTGRQRWEYDPKVPGEAGILTCCDVVNRGLAAWGRRLYLGTLDGRLIALDRDSGKLLWSKLTVDRSKPYAITGAPRVIDGRVIIGNAGAEMGVRGYVAAYDSDDGNELWRFYTVPDRPGANAAPHLKRAEATW